MAAKNGLSRPAAAEAAQELDLPLIDYHAHLGGEVTLERAIEISRAAARSSASSSTPAPRPTSIRIC